MLSALALVLLQQATSDTGFAARAMTAAAAENIENFDSVQAKPHIRGVALLDIDGDGHPEAFVWLDPAFRQTPTVLVYQTLEDGQPHRLTEALAPGPLVGVSGDLGDTHTLGIGVDMFPSPSPEGYDTLHLISSALDQGLSVVRYPHFFHLDQRANFTSYLDLASEKLPGSDSLTCGSFQFSHIDDLRSGHLPGGGPRQYLAALTSAEATIYSFDGLGPNSKLMKHSWTVPRPTGARGLMVTPEGTLAFAMADGSLRPLPSHP